ncbi:MAG: hypothetical protein QNJ92_05855 [Alphaproteobacteria bacterium]|nr:hypothetical protein [Alphaproteobacteria bacterium]
MNGRNFIDGVGEIRMRDGVIRMDLLALSPVRRDKEGRPVPEFVEQLVMSPEAFLRMFRSLAGTVQEMQKQGILRRREDGEAEGAGAEPAAASSDEAGASSPNF